MRVSSRASLGGFRRRWAPKALVLCILAVSALSCAPVEPEIELGEGPALALEGVVLLDPVHGESSASTLIVQGERIAAVLEGSEGRLPERVRRVEATGLFVLPGLWDLHTHLAMADSHAPPLLVSQGVTGVRDLGGLPDEVEALRARIESGALLGPRMVRAGPTLNGAQNGPQHRVIASEVEAREAVLELRAAGVDLLKVHNAIGREAYFALIEAAREAGLAVAGHVPVTVEPSEACAAGQASIEHIATLFEGTYLSSFDSELDAFLAMDGWLAEELDDLVGCFAEHETLFVPTLRAYELRAHRAAAYDEPDPGWRYVSAEGYESWRERAQPGEIDRRQDVIELRESLVTTGYEVVRRLHAAGAPVGTGTDLASPGLLPGFDLHAEIRLFGESGLDPQEALRAATRGPGDHSGGDPLQGELVPGAPADLLLLRGNAFESLDALDQIEGVVLRGRHLDRTELDSVLESIER